MFKFIIIEHVETNLHWNHEEKETDDKDDDQIPDDFPLFVRTDYGNMFDES